MISEDLSFSSLTSLSRHAGGSPAKDHASHTSSSSAGAPPGTFAGKVRQFLSSASPEGSCGTSFSKISRRNTKVRTKFRRLHNLLRRRRGHTHCHRTRPYALSCQEPTSPSTPASLNCQRYCLSFRYALRTKCRWPTSSREITFQKIQLRTLLRLQV
jgi:hypothetical protein